MAINPKWSYSASALFRRCQRKWYFHHCVASHQSHTALRYEAYIFKKLQTVEQWRGTLVDTVITERIVKPLNRRGQISLEASLRYARKLFNQQFEFSKNGHYHKTTQKEAGNKYAALYAHNYGIPIENHELEQARADVEHALTTLFNNQSLMRMIVDSEYRIAQRSLTYSVGDVSVKAIPDLILFFTNEPPIIIDWKVHSHSNYDYWLQLASYAIALTEQDPHKDFRGLIGEISATDIQLLEVHLLTDEIRPYQLDDEDVEILYEYIHQTGIDMIYAVSDHDRKKPYPYDQPRTSFDDCATCHFHKMCWMSEKQWEQTLAISTQ